MTHYDRAVTVFSPDGQLLQVQYAQEAVRKGSACVGVRGANTIVLAVERRAVGVLQDNRTERKIVQIDDHVMMAFAGLRADARVLVTRAQIECKSYKLTVDDPVTIEYITKFIATLKQSYTQGNGRRPFGLSCLIAGFDYDGGPHLFQTEPSGMYYEWLAGSTGRCNKTVQEFLEKNYNASTVASDSGCIKLALRALFEVIPHGYKNIDVVVLKKNQAVKIFDAETINFFVSEIDKQRESEGSKKKPRK